MKERITSPGNMVTEAAKYTDEWYKGIASLFIAEVMPKVFGGIGKGTPTENLEAWIKGNHAGISYYYGEDTQFDWEKLKADVISILIEGLSKHHKDLFLNNMKRR